MSTSISRIYDFVDDRVNGVAITASRIDAEFDQLITSSNQKVIISASAPSSPIAEMFWADSTNKLLKEYRNSEWVIHGILHISTTAPATMQAGDGWIDSSGSENVVKVRNKANGAWLTLLQTSDIVATILPLIYPIGSIYGNRTASTNPATLLGFGTWVAIGGFIVGLDGSTEFLTAGQTGGAKTATISAANLPASGLTVNTRTSPSGTGSGDITLSDNTGSSSTKTLQGGSGTAMSILPPYTVGYLWYRTA